MSQILQKAAAHFREQLNNPMDSVEVPEWGARIWFKRVTTLKEESKIMELTTQGKTVEALVESIILRARNEDGSRMFNMADRVTMMNEVDPKVIVRIAGAMNGVQLDSNEEVEKN